MNFSNGAMRGLVAYYSLHYQPKAGLGETMREFARVLCAGGSLLIVAKEGSSEGWIEDPLGSGQKVFWSDFKPEQLQELAIAHGFDVTSCEIRDPLPEEIAVRRIYLSARRAEEKVRAQ